MKIEEFSFRKAVPSDIDFLLQGFRATHGGLSHADEDGFRERLLDDLLTEDPKASLLLLENNGDKAGYILFSNGYFASTGLVLWVSQAYVAPEFRGRGSRALLEATKSIAKEYGAARLIWATDAQKKELSPLWRRIGAKEWTDDYTFWGLKP